MGLCIWTCVISRHWIVHDSMIVHKAPLNVIVSIRGTAMAIWIAPCPHNCEVLLLFLFQSTITPYGEEESSIVKRQLVTYFITTEINTHGPYPFALMYISNINDHIPNHHSLFSKACVANTACWFSPKTAAGRALANAPFELPGERATFQESFHDSNDFKRMESILSRGFHHSKWFKQEWKKMEEDGRSIGSSWSSFHWKMGHSDHGRKPGAFHVLEQRPGVWISSDFGDGFGWPKRAENSGSMWLTGCW